MKLVAKVLAVLAVLAVSTPALACGDKTTHPKSASDAKASSSQTVAKSGDKKAATHAKHGTAAKPATAPN